MKTRVRKDWMLVFLILPLLILMSGCDEISGETEEIITRSFTVSEGGTLTMEVRSGAIEVAPQAGNSLNVKVIRKAGSDDAEEAKEIFARHPVEFSQSGNNVTVLGRGDRERRLFSFSRHSRYRARYIVTVPPKYNLNLKTSGGSISVGDLEGNLEARTSGGSLHFGQIRGKVLGDTSGGSIHLEGCTDDADLETSGGSITVGSVAGTLRADTNGGAIRISEVQGTVNARTSGGSISAAITKQPGGDCSLKTSGGSISLYLADDIKGNLDASTSGGGVSTDFPITVEGEMSRHRISGKINGGGPEIFLHTSGGSVVIRKLKAED